MRGKELKFRWSTSTFPVFPVEILRGFTEVYQNRIWGREVVFKRFWYLVQDILIYKSLSFKLALS